MFNYANFIDSSHPMIPSHAGGCDMKVLLISGSGRQDGNTSRALGIFRERLERASGDAGVVLEVETVHLGQAGISACRGCRACFDHGEERCPLKDGLLPLRDKILAADALVIGSPVYVEDVSGLIKTLIDRMAFFSHRPALYGKCACLLTTSGGRSTRHALRTMSVALTTWGAKVLGGDMLFLGALTRKEVIAEKYGETLKRSADNLLKTLRTRSADTPTLFSIVSFRVQQSVWRRMDPDSLDHRYWAGKGWLEKGCGYYMPCRVGFLRRGAAWLLSGAAIAVFK